MCNDYVNGGLKNVDVLSKIVSLQCSWLRRLFDNSYHPWKLIPSFLIRKYLGKNFKFHSNLRLSKYILLKFPKFYQQLFCRWGKLSSPANIPSAIANQFIWFNKRMQIDHKTVHIKSFSDKGLNFVGQLFTNGGELKTWNFLKLEFCLSNNKRFQWCQLIHSLPKDWKEKINSFEGNLNDFLIKDHHLIKGSQVHVLEKLDSMELYNIQILLKSEKPTCQLYHEKQFLGHIFEWKKIYTLPRIITRDSRLRIFQYKLINNVLYLNKSLFRFRIVTDSLCSFCKSFDESPLHLFHDCTFTQNLWNRLRNYLSENILIPPLTPQSAIFGFIDTNDSYLIINHLHLIFKYFIYKERASNHLDFYSLKVFIMRIRYIEEAISKTNPCISRKFYRKWKKIIKKFE